jgi:ribonuclease Z
MLTFTLLACTDAFIDHELARLDDTSALEDGGLHVVLGGTGTLSTDDRAGSSVAVLAAGEVLVFDVGPGSTRVLGSNDVPMSEISQVFLTHLHSDHFGDLGELTIASEVLGRDEPITVHGPEGVDDLVEGFEQAYAMDHAHRAAQHPGNLDADLADLRVERVQEGLVYSHEGLTVTAFPVDHHPVPEAWGYRVDYNGRSVVISGDTAPNKGLIGAAEGADVLVHEAMDKDFAEDIALRAEARGDERTATLIRDALPNHSTAEDAAFIAQNARVEALVLTHVSPPLVAPHLRRRFRRNAERGFDGEVIVGADGLRIDLEGDLAPTTPEA